MEEAVATLSAAPAQASSAGAARPSVAPERAPASINRAYENTIVYAQRLDDVLRLNAAQIDAQRLERSMRLNMTRFGGAAPAPGPPPAPQMTPPSAPHPAIAAWEAAMRYPRW